MECGNDEIADLARRISARLFPLSGQQEACARHLAQLLAERKSKEPVTPKMLKEISQSAVALTMKQ